jgi:N6-L-threonylcarbamoyladenine synthase
MITLGIETSCDETSAAIVRDGKILSNVVFSSIREHKRYGGVVPEIASRSHLETVLPCIDGALKKARVGSGKLDLIAVTHGPGLVGSLLVGLSAAKSLSLAQGLPIIGVDHVLAHLYAGFVSDPKLKFPVLGLVVSGGHTVLLRMDSPVEVRLLGTTIDDAAGEAFDKVAKMLGLGYPGGPVIDRLGRGQDPAKFRFTRPLLSSDSLDFSFSGLKTAVFYEIEALRRRKKLTAADKKAVAAGFQEAVVDVLVEKTRRAVRREKIAAVVVGGGVAANSRLRERLAPELRKEGARAVFPAFELCQDNAAMIAAYGAARYRAGDRGNLDLAVYASWKSNPKNTVRISKKNT